MMHKGTARGIGGNMPEEMQREVEKLLDEFGVIVERISQERRLPRAIVRSRFPCSLLVLLDAQNLYIIAQYHFGLPNTTYLYRPKLSITPEQALDTARWEFGFTDPFLITFPASLLEQSEEERKESLEAITLTHIESEIQRAKKLSSLVQINPIFGPASYSVDEKLVFVLMPFDEDLTRIYQSIIKPTVESMGLICRRADDYKTSRAIIQDIWKAICEARIIIADLTNLNPNVMYELGIAHTVGKETILIYQRKEKEIKFPFDLIHIRRIEYEDTALGGKKLENDLKETIKTILKSPTIS